MLSTHITSLQMALDYRGLEAWCIIVVFVAVYIVGLSLTKSQALIFGLRRRFGFRNNKDGIGGSM